MNANAPKQRLTRRIGEPEPSLAATFGLAALVFFLLSTLAQTIVAWMLGFNPSLGPNWHGIYLPFAAVRWYVMVAQPFNAILGRPIALYPANVVAVVRLLPFIGGAIVAVSITTMFVVNAVISRPLTPEQEEDLFDSGAVWADAETAREDGLLGGKCGPVLGGFTVGNKVRLLRYGGESGGQYTAPPGDWKSLFISMNSLIEMQHADAHTWSAEERRLHPWGEEPIVLRFSPKFEYWRNLSGGEAAPKPEGLGKRMILLAPNGTPSKLKVDKTKLGCYNPAWSLGLGSDQGVQDALIAADSIISTAAASNGTAHATHWDRATLGWGSAVWEKLGFYAFNRGRPEMFSLPGFYDFLSAFPSLDALLDFMLNEPDDPLGFMKWTMLNPESGRYEPTNVKPSIVQAARQMKSRDVKERSAIYSTLVAYMVKYSSDSLRRYITRSSFGYADLANDPDKATVIEVGFDPMDGVFLQPYLRQKVRAMLRELTRAGTDSIDGRSVRPHLRPWILRIDEANILQYVEEFEMGSGFIRAYGGFLEFIWQAEDGQLHKWYTDKNPIKETLGWRLYGAPKTVKAAKPIEEELGYRKVPVTFANTSGDRFAMNPLMHMSESTQLVDLPLWSAKKITQMGKPNYIGFVNGHNYYLKKAPVFKIDMLKKRMKRPYVVECEDCYEGKQPFFIQSLSDAVTPHEWDQWMEHVKGASEERDLGDDPIYPSADLRDDPTSEETPADVKPELAEAQEAELRAHVSEAIREAQKVRDAAKRAQRKTEPTTAGEPS